MYEGDMQKLCTPFLDEDKEGGRCSVNRPQQSIPVFSRFTLHSSSLACHSLSTYSNYRSTSSIDIMCLAHLNILKRFRVDLGTLFHISPPPAYYLGLLKCECGRIPCCRKTKTAYLEEIKNKSRGKKTHNNLVLYVHTDGGSVFQKIEIKKKKNVSSAKALLSK